MATLPPPPVNDKPGSFTWLEWYRQLRNYVSTSGSVPWYIINFAGSNITDIASRLHNQLQGLQGGTNGEMYHLSQQHYAAISNHLELVDSTATQTVPTTPTVLKPPTTTSSNGITYNPTTGEIVFTNGGTYSLTILVNAKTSTSNKTLYFYTSYDTGSGYTVNKYSGRSVLLKTTTEEQSVFSSSQYHAAGTKLKLYLWADSNTFTFDTVDIPGTASAATIPAVRILFSGSL